jgi:leucyl-tRNA synthetase
MILGEDGMRMSKSRGNVVNPDDVIREYGADTLRMYEMFMGPLEAEKPWSTGSISGIHRFLDRCWRLSERKMSTAAPPESIERTLHKTIKKVTDDTSQLEFNTAIAQMMIFVNELFKEETNYRTVWESFVLLLSPYAPHLGEELWRKLGHTGSNAYAPWPVYREELTRDQEVTIVVQVNGKLRDRIAMPAGASEQDVIAAARNSEKTRSYLDGKTVLKTIAVPDKLVNFVVK